MMNIHASSVYYKNKGILFMGPSGSGKSDVCFRLIMTKNAALIADDRTNISIENGKIYASSPEQIEGLLEIRGIGIKKFPTVSFKQIDLAVELVKNIKEIERLPEPDFFEIDGAKVPKIKLYAFESSLLEKIDISLF